MGSVNPRSSRFHRTSFQLSSDSLNPSSIARIFFCQKEKSRSSFQDLICPLFSFSPKEIVPVFPEKVLKEVFGPGSFHSWVSSSFVVSSLVTRVFDSMRSERAALSNPPSYTTFHHNFFLDLPHFCL